MKTLFIILLILLLIPTKTFAWIPKTVDLYRDKQVEPVLRPEKELEELERTPATDTEVKKENKEQFEFRQEHMNKILEQDSR